MTKKIELYIINTMDTIVFKKYVQEDNVQYCVIFECDTDMDIAKMRVKRNNFNPQEFEHAISLELNENNVELDEFSREINPYYQDYGYFLKEQLRLYDLL